MLEDVKVSICIANYKQDHLLPEALESCKAQNYSNIETVVYNDLDGCGSGGAFNRAIIHATGDIVVLLCADDVFTDSRVISDIVKLFKSNKYLVHVSRHYHQFIDGDRRPVRAWRGNDVIELANNPSGLAFKRESIIHGEGLSNKMFVEAPALVRAVLRHEWEYEIMEWDTVAVRIHNSTARSKDYYKKRWVSSPIEEWTKLGGKSLLRDYTSLIQIKNYFTTRAVLKECWNFIRLRPLNILSPGFWFFSIIAICTPRTILRHIPHLYRITIGRWTTREVKRP